MEEVSRSKLGLGGGGSVVDARMKVMKKKDETSFEKKNKGRGRSEVFVNKEGGLEARERVSGAHPAGVDLPDGDAVGRLGAALVATGKGGGAARNTTMTATTGKTKMGNFEWEPNGSFNVMKGRARVSPKPSLLTMRAIIRTAMVRWLSTRRCFRYHVCTVLVKVSYIFLWR